MTKKRTETIPLNTDTETMLISAVRYACGRRTYIVGMTVGYMIPLLPRLSDWCINIMERDISEQFAINERTGGNLILGDECDVRDWTRLLTDIRAEIAARPDFKAWRVQND